MHIYAGIGSRDTPENIILDMANIGYHLASIGWKLRSGHADGADKAFEYGAKQAKGEMEIYLPWAGFNNAPHSDVRYIVPEFTPQLLELAAKHHPAWFKCSQGAQKLHARNGCQVLGLDLKTPAQMVVCWTANAKGLGGTGQAIRIARANEIPVFDLADDNQRIRLIEFVQALV